jgi:hypothetical protein
VCAIELFDNKVSIAALLQPANHRDALTRTRMQRVVNQNIKPMFLGSMSPSRKVR